MPLNLVSTSSVRVIVSTRLSNLMSVDLACEHEMHLRDKEEFTSFTVAFWLVQFHGSGSFLHEIGLVQRPSHACSQPPYFSTKLSRRSIQAWWRRLLSSSSFLFLLLKTHPANFILIPQSKSCLAAIVAMAAQLAIFTLLSNLYISGSFDMDISSGFIEFMKIASSL